MIDLFLTTKDVLSDMVSAYRQSEPLDPDVSLSLRENLVNLKKEPASSAQNRPSITQSEHLKIHIESIRPQDATALRSEMAIMGEVLHEEAKDDSITFWLDTSTAVDDIIAVSCFVVNEEQITTAYASLPGPAQENQTKSEIAQPNRTKTQTGSARRSESSTLRVGVKRVDQIINLVGELVITQAMLVQTAEDLDPVVHDRLLNGLEQLERNARDLQEAVMAIRMVPMDYVFNRFPRVVRENAQRLGKNIRLVTKGQATELDKSLIERIIDPLTHLVRNCIDHGLEMPEQRLSVGKEAEGVLTLSAQHQGGHIIIEVIDDGAGLNREKILQKAMQQGLVSNENISDEELWQLLFAPGFSTAEKVTEISGRGVGMDVVRRNIQGMGGHVYVTSQKGQGTTTRIVLPL